MLFNKAARSHIQEVIQQGKWILKTSSAPWKFHPLLLIVFLFQQTKSLFHFGEENASIPKLRTLIALVDEKRRKNDGGKPPSDHYFFHAIAIYQKQREVSDHPKSL